MYLDAWGGSRRRDPSGRRRRTAVEKDSLIAFFRQLSRSG